MGSRRLSRVTSLKMLYLADLCKFTEAEAAVTIGKDKVLDEKSNEFCTTLTKGVLSDMDEIDKIIIKYAENWELKRMAAVDRNILRIASYELLSQPQTPVNVIIDEAVEIAKEYSTIDSGKFVNGILDKIKDERKELITENPRKPNESQS